jgi:hypothetical protein
VINVSEHSPKGESMVSGDRGINRADNPFRATYPRDGGRPRDFVAENNEIVNKEAAFLRKLIKPTEGNLNCAEQAFYSRALRRLWKIRHDQRWVNDQGEGFNAKHAFLMAYRGTLTPILGAEISTSIGWNINGASAWYDIRYVDTKQHADDVTIQHQVLYNLRQEAFYKIRTSLHSLDIQIYNLAKNQAQKMYNTAIAVNRNQNDINNKQTLFCALDTLWKQRHNNNYPDFYQISDINVIDSLKNATTAIKQINTQNQMIANVINHIQNDPILNSFL